MKVIICYMIMCVVVLLFAGYCMGGLEPIPEQEGSSKVEPSKVEPTPEMSVSECITLCNDVFTRADERLNCHSQCHDKFD